MKAFQAHRSDMVAGVAGDLLPPRHQPDPKQQLVKSAADLVGRNELAMHFGIAESLLDAWIRGDATMPDGKLLILATLLDKVASAKK